MQVNPYLHFDGQCEAAFKFYEKTLGGKLEGIFTYGNSPMAEQMPPEHHNRVMHATLAFGGSVLMGADSPPGRHQQPQGFSVSINLNDVAEAERIFKALSEKGQVELSIQETFWAARFGMLTDQFGIPWMINCGQAG